MTLHNRLYYCIPHRYDIYNDQNHHAPFSFPRSSFVACNVLSFNDNPSIKIKEDIACQ